MGNSTAKQIPAVGLTVYDATYNLLRTLGLTTVFGNPGSTEQPFLKNFPNDFQYILGLQEASAVAMADGFAQETNKPVLVNLHTAAGTGNGLGNIMTAFLNKTPLIITAGQQTREMILCEPMLTNRDETIFPRPWVKWAYQPVRAQDVPGAIMRAYAIALQPPAGPVYVSIPLDDWDQPALGEAVVRSVSSRYAPDPDRLAEFAKRIRESKRPALVYGQEIDRSGGWEAGIQFAEQLRAPVFLAPLAERTSFPQNHPQFQGMLPMAKGPLGQRLRDFDLAIVVGAQIFRYYPYLAGEYIPHGTELLQITSDPNDAGAAAVGDSLLGDAKLTLELLIQLVPQTTERALPTPLPANAPMPQTPHLQLADCLEEKAPERQLATNSRGPHYLKQRHSKQTAPQSLRFQSNGSFVHWLPRERKLASGTEDRRLSSPCVQRNPRPGRKPRVKGTGRGDLATIPCLRCGRGPSGSSE